MQTTYASREAVRVPEGGEGGQDEIHHPVEVHHVQSEDLNDDLGGEHDEGAREGGLERLYDGPVRGVIVCVEGGVARVLDQLVLLPWIFLDEKQPPTKTRKKDRTCNTFGCVDARTPNIFWA